jgi:hypothetical protein
MVAAAMAQDVFRWVDANGIVNYGDAVPEGIDEFERIVIAPPPVPTARPAAAAPGLTVLTPAAPAEDTAAASEPEFDSAPAVADAAPIEVPPELTPDALDQACEVARERALAPLREAAIAECKAAPRANPAFCERFYADFGDGGVTREGVQRPRMFDDLPECVAARDARAGRRTSRSPRQ